MALIDRAKRILLKPKEEWPVIEKEATTAAELYGGYIAPLAAIGPVASWIGMSVFGFSLPFVGTYRVPLLSGLARMIVSYLLTLAGVYVLALVIDSLAPTFGGQRNPAQALKVTAYSFTAGWVAGIFGIIPQLALLGILGLYSLYLLYLGLPVLMKSPPERSLGYTIAVIVATVVLFVVIWMVGGLFVSQPMGRLP